MSLREQAQERDPEGSVALAEPPASPVPAKRGSAMSWFTVDCDLPDHPKLLELPNDSARYGWIVTLARAKRQRHPGQFDSERHYRGVLQRYAKYMTDYLTVGLLERDEDGALRVHDWQRYQWKVTKQGQREDIGRTLEGQEKDSRARNAVSVPVSVDVSVSDGNGGVGLGGGEAAVFAFIAQNGAAIREDKPLGLRLIALCERRTPERVLETAWDMAQRNGKLSDRQWVLGLENRLEPIEDGKEAAKRERTAEAERQSARGFEDTQRYLRELRGELT